MVISIPSNLQVNDIFVMRAPSNLSVQLVSPLAIRIAWADDSQFENGYVVRKKDKRRSMD